MNFRKRALNCIISTIFFMLVTLMSFGQQNPNMTNGNSSVTLKTFRGLFPNVPVAIANELHGGLHVVKTVDQLHGTGTGNLVLDNKELQKGMLVWVEDMTMYYRFLDPNNDGTNTSSTATIVDENYWDPITNLFPDQEFENVTIVNGCSPSFSLDPSSGVVDKDGDSGTPSDQETFVGASAGDHLILRSGTSTNPLAAYVWDNDANNDGDATTNDAAWVLVATGTKVLSSSNGVAADWSIDNAGDLTGTGTENYDWNDGDVLKIEGTSYVYDGDSWIVISSEDDDMAVLMPNADLQKDPTGNGHLPANYKEGDLVKLVQGDEYITYVLNGIGGWMEVGRGVNVVDVKKFPVYSGSFSGPTITANTTQGIYVNLDAFRKKINDAPGSEGLSVQGLSDGVVIQYPAMWGELNYSIKSGNTTLELTNGVTVNLVEKDITIDGATYTIDYKQVTIPCGVNTIVVR